MNDVIGANIARLRKEKNMTQGAARKPYGDIFSGG